MSFYSFVPDCTPLASIKQVSNKVPQVWRLSFKYLHVQDVNKICRSCFLIPEQVSEIHVRDKKILDQ
jgi:hypothetical protein